jgi:hypothetical protein
VPDFVVLMKKCTTAHYLLVAGAPNGSDAMRIARRYSIAFGVPLSAKRAGEDPSEPEPPISLYIPSEHFGDSGGRKSALRSRSLSNNREIRG